MAEPRSKKVKMSANNTPNQIVIPFASRGLQPDLSISISDGIEFRLHSDVLKLHSKFFRSSLNETAGEQSVASFVKPGIKYELVTTISNDGTWVFVASSDVVPVRVNPDGLGGEVTD